MHAFKERLYSHRRACQQSEPTQLPVSSWLAPSLAMCPGLCHYTCIWNWPLPVQRHLHLVLVAKCVYTTGFGYYCFSFWSLAVGPGGTTEDPTSPHSLCGLSTDHVVVTAVDPVAWAKRHHEPQTQCHHTPPYLAPCTIRPGVKTCLCAPTCRWVFPY